MATAVESTAWRWPSNTFATAALTASAGAPGTTSTVTTRSSATFRYFARTSAAFTLEVPMSMPSQVAMGVFLLDREVEDVAADRRLKGARDRARGRPLHGHLLAG